MKLPIYKNILLAALLFPQFISAINIRYIKDTYTILKPEYKQLSPAHGPVWWEKKIAENNYKYAGDPLTKYLFNVPQVQGAGALQAEDFVITRSEFFPATYFTPKTLGRLLGTIEKIRPAIMTAQAKVAAIRPQKKAPQAGQLSAKQIASKKEVDALKKQLKGQLEQALKTDTEYQKLVDVYLKGLAGNKFAESGGKIISAQEKMIRAILSSLDDAGFFDLMGDVNNPIYTPYQTYSILLAFLFRKAEDVREGKSIGKADFKSYFDGLAELLGEELFTPEGKRLVVEEAWLWDAYGENVGAYRDEIRALVLPIQSLNQLLLDQLYEKMVFAELSRPLGLPKIAAYREGSLFAGQTFTDCMDTLMRNASNVALFDPTAHAFSFAMIENAQPNAAVTGFYGAHNAPAEVENPNVHNAWNLVIQNQPYVAYERIVNLQNPLARANVGNQGFKGFILNTPALQSKRELFEKQKIIFKDGSTEKFHVVNVNGIKFVLVDPARYAAYEVEPTLRNLIVLMNDMFGLNLYPDINSAFFKPNFNTTYFVPLADRFDWEYENAGLNLEAETLGFTIRAPGGSFSVKLSWGHGEINVRSKSKVEPYQEQLFGFLSNGLLAFVQANQLAANSFLINLFALYQNFGEGVFEKTMHTMGSIRQLKNLVYYTQLLGSSSAKIEVIKSIVQLKDTVFYEMCVELISRLDVGADFYYFQELSKIDFAHVGEPKILSALSKHYDALLQAPVSYFSLESAKGFLSQGLFADKAAQLARRAFESRDINLLVPTLQLYSMLVDKGYAYDGALAAALEGVEIKNRVLIFAKLEAKRLLVKLIKKGHGYDAASAYASRSLNAPEVAIEGLELYTILVEQGRDYANAMALAQKAMAERHSDAKSLALKLYAALVEKGQYLPEAEAAALQALAAQDNKKMIQSALEVVIQLIKKGRIPQNILQILQIAITNPIVWNRKLVLPLFQGLIARGNNIPEIIEMANNAVQQKYGNSFTDGEIALGTLLALVDAGYAYQEAVKALPTAIDNWSSSAEIEILKLIGKLVDRDLALEVAKNAVQALENAKNDKVRLAALELKEKLETKGIIVKEMQ